MISKRLPVVYLVAALVLSVLGLTKPLKADGPIPGARIFDHFVGRAIATPSGANDIFGYFTFLDGIPGPFFAGTPSEATALFTFRTSPVVFSNVFVNGSILFATLEAPSTFSVYFNASPHGDWSKPNSFSSGQLIATFKRAEGFFTCNGDLTLLNTCSNVISGKLASSVDFTFHGKEFNLKKLVPLGITNITPMLDTSFPNTCRASSSSTTRLVFPIPTPLL